MSLSFASRHPSCVGAREGAAYAIAGPPLSEPRLSGCQGCRPSALMLLQVHTYPGHARPSARAAACQPRPRHPHIPDQRGAGLHRGRHPAVHRHAAPIGRHSGAAADPRHQQVRLKTSTEAPVEAGSSQGWQCPLGGAVCAVLLSSVLMGFSELMQPLKGCVSCRAASLHLQRPRHISGARQAGAAGHRAGPHVMGDSAAALLRLQGV